MQNAELFRRGVVLPLNLEAESGLRTNDIDENAAVRYLEIPDQSAFEALWASGLFQAINAKAGSLIDDYEEEFIETAAIDHVLQAVNEVRSSAKMLNAETQSFLAQLSDLVQESEQLKLPILFVL
jgi:hypothetical protein